MVTLRKFDHKLDWLLKMDVGRLTPYYSTPLGAALVGDSLAMLKSLPSASVDLVMERTS